MNLDFEALLTLLTGLTGLITLVNRFVLTKQRQLHGQTKTPVWIEQSCAFFPILLLVLLLRSFLFEPFRIPSGSLEPTLQIGDFVLVNKFIYGLRLPVIHKKLIAIHSPKRGDIIVFRHPTESVDYIKRVIGLPGDKISYIDKTLYINDQPIHEIFKCYSVETDSEGNECAVIEKEENLNGIHHSIFIKPDNSMLDTSLLPSQSTWVVPKGHYFMMGDNRDNSLDSRYWGFVPDDCLKGKAILIWLSWDKKAYGFDHIRWSRIGKWL